jgi:hypothetical protein
MEQTEAMAETGGFADPEVFSFFLSAFQAAARSVIQTLETGKCASLVDEWRRNLDDKDRALITFMQDERDREVHRSGTTEQATMAMVPITEIRPPRHLSHPAHHGIYYFAPPGTPVPTIGVRRHFYKVGSLDEDRVTSFGRRYSALLGQLVDLVQQRVTK